MAPVYPDWAVAIYDPLYTWRDYRSQARSIQTLVRRLHRGRARTLLDVACGTGRHLEYLTRRFNCAGLDQSGAMLRIARGRLGPGVPLHRADMRTFQLRVRFDVVTCLFSAIGHLPTLRDHEAAIARMADHLNPGGLLMVEPWIFPEDVRMGPPHLITSRAGGEIILRLSTSVRKGRYLDLDMHYLTAKAGGRIVHRSHVFRCRLTTRQELDRAFRGAGLRVQFVRNRLWNRGLFIGTRPG